VPGFGTKPSGSKEGDRGGVKYNVLFLLVRERPRGTQLGSCPKKNFRGGGGDTAPRELGTSSRKQRVLCRLGGHEQGE